MFSFYFGVCILMNAIAKPIAPRKVIYAVDCGGNRDLKTSLGVQFLKDQNYSTDVESVAVDYYLEPELSQPHVKYSPDTSLYMSERHAEASFSYFIPLLKNYTLPNSETTYVLILKFAEFYFREAGRRIFNVKIGEKRVIEGLDVFALVGYGAAHDEYIEFKYNEGKVYFKNQECLNAINQGKNRKKKNNKIENQLIVVFEKTEFDNPSIEGILLFKGPLEETDYKDREEYIENWEKKYQNISREEKKAAREAKVEQRKEEIKKKQEKIKIREGFEKEIEKEQSEEIVQSPNRRELPPFSWELLKILLLSPMGVVCMIGFFTSTFVLVAFTFFDPYGQKKFAEEREARLKKLREDKERRKLLDTTESSTSSISDKAEHQQKQEEPVQQQQQPVTTKVKVAPANKKSQ